MIVVLVISVMIYLFIYYEGLPHWMTMEIFNIFNTVLYILINVWYLRKYKTNNLFCFELLFALSFWICCFYLHLVKKQLDFINLVFSQMLIFSDDLLCRSIVLCMLGYLFYMLGLIPLKSKKRYSIYRESSPAPTVNKILNCLTTIFIVLFFALGGGNFINSYDRTVMMDEGRFGSFGFALNYSILLLNITCVSNLIFTNYEKGESVWHFVKKQDLLFIFNQLTMSLFLLLCGYRSGVMQIVLPIFAILSYKNILKKKQIILMILLGVVVMAFVGHLRSRVSTITEISNEISLIEFFRDFNSANSAVPALMEYVDCNGNANFKNAILQILSVIPFLQSLAVDLLGQDFFMESSSRLYTYKISNSYSGLGTNIIGDLYYTGGFWCVLALMLFLGSIIRKTSKSTSVYGLLIYACLVGNAVFFSRVEFFYIVKSCSLSVIIYWLINKLFPYRSYNKSL